MIEIQKLNFFYGDRQILFDINLTLHENSITGLIGPNGAGKSTLMRCIAGLEIPQQGQVLLNHVPILTNPQHSYTQLGYLPDIFGLAEQLTVLQYWTYSAHAKGVPASQVQSSIEKTAHLLNLADKLSYPIRELSRGQRQRVGIGQVIIHQPKLLILDEPASGLDPETRYELSQLFNQLRSQGMTLLISSHILSELDEYCTHVLVLKQGKIVNHQEIHQGNSQFIYTQQSYIPLVLRFSELNDEIQSILSQLPILNHLQFDVKQKIVIASVQPDPEYRMETIQYCVEQRLPLIGVEILKESLLHTYQQSVNDNH